MLVAGDEVGTVDYAGTWWVLAFILLGLVVVWNGGLLIWGRPGRVRSRRGSHGTQLELRGHYLARLADIEAAHARGDVSERIAHQEVSALVRRYVEERSGVAASAMTLQDLRERELSGLTDLVELAYPPAFEPSASDGGRLDRTLAAARRIVGAR